MLTLLTTWLLTDMNLFIILGSAVALAFMILVGAKLAKEIMKLDLSDLFYAKGSKKISGSRFWNTIGFFVATVCFVYFNFALPSSGALEAIWLIYLSVVAGAASLSKYISAKYGSGDEDDDSLPLFRQKRKSPNLESAKPEDYEN